MMKMKGFHNLGKKLKCIQIIIEIVMRQMSYRFGVSSYIFMFEVFKEKVILSQFCDFSNFLKLAFFFSIFQLNGKKVSSIEKDKVEAYSLPKKANCSLISGLLAARSYFLSQNV